MSWLGTIFIALITGAVGLFVSGYVANLAVTWYRISSFEGGSGYFVVFTALGGLIAGLVIGVLVSRVVALTADPTFAKGLGFSVLCMLLTVVVVGGVSRLKADVPPTIDGEELMLMVEARWPADHTESPALVPGMSYLQLGSVTRAHVQRVSKKGALWKEDAHLVDGRWTVPGAVPIFTTRGSSSLDVALNDSVHFGILLPLRSRPTKADFAWSDWYPRDGRNGPPKDASVNIRYRVQKRTAPIRTEKVGPFEVSAIISGFLNGGTKTTNTLDAYARFDVRFQGKPIHLGNGTAPSADDESSRVNQVAELPSEKPALLVLVSPVTESSYCAVLYADGDTMKEVNVGPCSNAIQTEELTSDPVRFRETRYPDVPRGRVDRDTYKQAELLQFYRMVVNVRSLTFHRYTASSPHSPVPSVNPLGISPDGHSFVRFAMGDGGESDPMLVVTNFAANEVYDLKIDPVRMRYAKLESLDPAWLLHYFTWQRGADGVDRLIERPGFVPIPFHGVIDVEADDRPIYRLEKGTAALRQAILDMLANEFKAQREPVEADAYEIPVTIEGQKLNVAYSSEFAFVSVALEHGEKITDLVQRIGTRFNALLATGRYDKDFVP